MNVSFHSQALAEYVAAVAWYEHDYGGRGERFHAAVERTLSSVAQSPTAFPERLGAHAAVVRRFPYVLFFEIVDAETIRVLAVAHTKRKPGYWRERGR